MNRDLARLVLGPDWQFLEKHLQEERERSVSALLNASNHDISNLLRGKIKELDTLLRLRDQAKRLKEGKL